MTLFQQLMTTSSSHEEKPLLLDPCSTDPVAVAFLKKFGKSWRRTPAKGVWYLESNGLQFSMMAYGGVYDIAIYRYATVKEWRAAFESKTHVGNAVYFQTLPTDYWSGSAIIRFLRESGELDLLNGDDC